MVQRYFAASEDWDSSADSSVRVIARLRNGAPLVVEKNFGKGRVVAFLTSAAPTWNNWARNPSFVVVLQDLQAYLSERAPSDATLLVGEPLTLKLDPTKYIEQVRFVTPSEDSEPSATTNATLNAEGKLVVSLNETDLSGIYEARLTRKDNSVEIRRYAINVNSSEGNLAALDKSQLAERLKDIKYEYEQASMFQSAGQEMPGFDLGGAILYILVILLIGEQVLAWSASYHPSASRAASAAGGAR
jgi:hypothetical protein